ncbi:MAG: MgtC/SapB family protein [Thermoguttaceae bacterium]|nr:MgtC/SapB family protein [Thermoguttaceae bacterium]MDW8079223.1 MgtC/SapB family protein [Thermoguttaceae bacterium]
MPEPIIIFRHLGLAVVLGLLVGLQREHSEANRPGMRTFTLITVLGTVCALLGQVYGGWVVAAGLVGLAAALLLPPILLSRDREPDPGITTDIAAMVMYGVGALLVILPQAPAIPVAIGGGVAVLLQFKPELHTFAHKLGDQDLRAIMQFALITCVILPVVPNQAFDPFGVLNPREAWLMVVLIVGISLLGYILYKFVGEGAGILLGAILGGAISSTAATVAYARQARSGVLEPRGAAVAVGIASAVVFIRILAEVAAVAPEMLTKLLLPCAVLLISTAAPPIVLYLRAQRTNAAVVQPRNPSELSSALFFGATYLLVLFALAVAKRYIAPEYLYTVAVISGLTDMDAITLSTARMFLSEGSQSWIGIHGWRLIMTGALANLLFKVVLAGTLGGNQLLRLVTVLLAPALGIGLVLIIFLP